jgi:hypothetical protein
MAPLKSAQPAPQRTSKRSKRPGPYDDAHQQHPAAGRTSRLPRTPADSPVSQPVLPESLVDVLSTIFADAVIEDLRKHPELTSSVGSEADRPDDDATRGS